MLLSVLGHTAEAGKILEEVIPLAEASGDVDSLRTALAFVGGAEIFCGEYRRATGHHRRMLALVEQLEDASWITFATACLSRDLFCLGEWEEARALTERAESLARAVPSGFSQWALCYSPTLYIWEGRWEHAERCLNEAIEQSERLNNLQIMREAHTMLAELDLLHDRPGEAIQRVEPLRSLPGHDGMIGLVLLPTLALAYLRSGDEIQAEATLQKLFKLARAFGQRPLLNAGLRVLAELHVHRNEWEEAEKSFTEAIDVAHQMQSPVFEARTLYDWGSLLWRKGETSKATTHLRAALTTFREKGAKRFAADLAAMLG